MKVKLTEQALLDAARGNTGLADFGDEADWHEGFQRLVQSLNEEARLNAVGRLIAFNELLRHLENRLRVTEDLKRHPGILDVEIVKPLFMVGLPRTGSTIMHDLLAKDPANRVPMTWECHLMSPPAEAASYETDPRIAVCEQHFEQTSRALIPEFQALHEMGALLAQECLMLNAFDFKSIIFANQFRIPGYQSWVENSDPTPVYRTHKRQLQYMQWRNPRERWVLKSTGYHWGLAAICEVYPDARIVMTHRDPLKLIASHCSLVSMACSMGSDEVDRIEIGQMWSRSWEEAMRRGVAFRESGHPVARGAFDMHFAEILKDQVDMAQRIYEHFDIPMSEEALRRMRSFIASNPRDRHGTHRYTLEQFGLDRSKERARYRFYQDYFKVAEE
ncbi:MAG TPA: sulfotransferase [Steroidobacteraceae bacterium]|nr:sulfotransferase [Steroidobacteraceae bacterium]HQX46162.1 sulfotransferase [Steroidobacteraceae bacterium]HQX77074.1 sulfotransferase [Steroidobacteraceae bacterium]